MTVSQIWQEVWKSQPNILLSVLLGFWGLPPCFINLFISSWDDALDASDVAVFLAFRSISVRNEQ